MLCEEINLYLRAAPCNAEKVVELETAVSISLRPSSEEGVKSDQGQLAFSSVRIQIILANVKSVLQVSFLKLGRTPPLPGDLHSCVHWLRPRAGRRGPHFTFWDSKDPALPLAGTFPVRGQPPGKKRRAPPPPVGHPYFIIHSSPNCTLRLDSRIISGFCTNLAFLLGFRSVSTIQAEALCVQVAQKIRLKSAYLKHGDFFCLGCFIPHLKVFLPPRSWFIRMNLLYFFSPYLISLHLQANVIFKLNQTELNCSCLIVPSVQPRKYLCQRQAPTSLLLVGIARRELFMLWSFLEFGVLRIPVLNERNKRSGIKKRAGIKKEVHGIVILLLYNETKISVRPLPPRSSNSFQLRIYVTKRIYITCLIGNKGPNLEITSLKHD